MNRRSFIAKALAGMAAIPLLSKLVNSQPEIDSPDDVTFYWRVDALPEPEPTRYVALIEHGEDGLREVKARGYQRMPFKEDAPVNFPIAEEDWGYVTHVAFAESPNGPISQLFDIHEWSRRTIKTGQATRLDLEFHYWN